MADTNLTFTPEELQQEIWKPIPKPVIETLYEVSNLGRVRRNPMNAGKNKRGGPILKQTLAENGYFRISLSRGKRGSAHLYPVHRLVALAFVGPPPEPRYEINHINGIKTDNKVGNLEWVTHSENILHAQRLGLKPLVGSATKLSAFKVLAIDWLLNRSYRPAAVAEYFRVSVSTVYAVKYNQNWKHITYLDYRP